MVAAACTTSRLSKLKRRPVAFQAPPPCDLVAVVGTLPNLPGPGPAACLQVTPLLPWHAPSGKASIHPHLNQSKGTPSWAQPIGPI
jgi:hypothetical protein